jgi:SAM-dependent methyltransferase
VLSRSVRDAYSARAADYAAFVADEWHRHGDEVALVRRHLVGRAGPVLDLGCGPGHWTAYLHEQGVDVTGVDVVPELVAHARATYPGPEFVLGGLSRLDRPASSVSGILAWYSTIHLPPDELDDVLAGFRRLLARGGVLVVGLFDSDDGVAAFDHAVHQEYRWPVDVFAERLARAGLAEVERVRRRSAERPDRAHAAVAVRAC